MTAVPNEPATAEAAPYKLSESLAALDLPQEQFAVDDAFGLLRAFVAGCDPRGRYYADAPLLNRLFWWQWTPRETVTAWRDELVAWGDLDIRASGMNCYSPDEPFDVAYLVDPRRFRRFRARRRIHDAIRQEVFRRDGYSCVSCGSAGPLTLDHIHPWSRGGEDHPTNLQTMCQPCNSAKGARVL